LGIVGVQFLELEKYFSFLITLIILVGIMYIIKGNSGFLDLKNLYKLLH